MALDNPIEGEIVYLKSGSPPLTVELTRDDECVAVTWFDGGQCCRDAFHKAALTRDHIEANGLG